MFLDSFKLEAQPRPLKWKWDLQSSENVETFLTCQYKIPLLRPLETCSDCQGPLRLQRLLPCEDLLDKSRLSQLVEDLLTCRYRLFNLIVLFLSFMPEIYYLGQSWFSSEKLPKTVQVCFTYNILCLVWNEDLFSWKNPSKYFLSFVIFWR